MSKLSIYLSKNESIVRKAVQSLPLFIVILITLFIVKYLGISLFKIEGTNPSESINKTSDVKHIDGTGDFNTGAEVGDSGTILESTLDIDIVYSILEKGKAGYDYSAISFKPQIKKPSEGSYIDSELLKTEYLPNNRYSLIIPKDITGGYLYISTRKELKYISNIGVYQPITLWTNIFFNKWRTYGRLDTEQSLPVYEANKEFLYKLSYVPIKNAKGTYRLGKKGSRLEIGGFVGDISGNGIDKIIFIWQR